MSTPAAAQTFPNSTASPKMRTLHLELAFLNPAFVGNAEQSGQWRTPPIKAQLRQWWRVAYAADHGFNVNVAAMRREEGLLFGNAWLDGEFSKSLVRIRLDKWSLGQLRSWQGLEQGTVHHAEVERTNHKVGPHAYLGYGPLDGRGSTRFAEKINAVIQAGEAATLSIAVPDEHAPILKRVLWLMNRYGTLGGRSRNGWGSYALSPADEASKLAGTAPLRPWRDCLALDWPHAIGKDDNDKPLIWQTAPHDDWKSLMKTLAILKIGLRTQFPFTTGRGASSPEERHWLSYPVTNHSVQPWECEFVRGKRVSLNLRLPNQLRFKVRKNGPLVGVIFHMPHLPPAAFNPNLSAIEDVWRKVHQFLDAPAQKLDRISE